SVAYVAVGQSRRSMSAAGPLPPDSGRRGTQRSSPPGKLLKASPADLDHSCCKRPVRLTVADPQSAPADRRPTWVYASDQRPDVLVHAEEVLRIVLRPQLAKTPVVRPISGCHRIARLIVAEVIHVSAGGGKGFHLLISLTRPGDAAIGHRPVHPLRQ